MGAVCTQGHVHCGHRHSAGGAGRARHASCLEQPIYVCAAQLSIPPHATQVHTVPSLEPAVEQLEGPSALPDLRAAVQRLEDHEYPRALAKAWQAQASQPAQPGGQGKVKSAGGGSKAAPAAAPEAAARAAGGPAAAAVHHLKRGVPDLREHLQAAQAGGHSLVVAWVGPAQAPADGAGGSAGAPGLGVAPADAARVVRGAAAAGASVLLADAGASPANAKLAAGLKVVAFPTLQLYKGMEVGCRGPLKVLTPPPSATFCNIPGYGCGPTG